AETYNVKITPKDGYMVNIDDAYLSFEVAPGTLQATYSASDTYTYSGAVQTPKVKVTNVKGDEVSTYTMNYWTASDKKTASAHTDAGDVYYYLTGLKSYYQGDVEYFEDSTQKNFGYFKILPMDLNSADINAAKIDDQLYTGNDVTLKAKDIVLTNTKTSATLVSKDTNASSYDYFVQGYQNNKEESTTDSKAKVILEAYKNATGEYSGNYTGTRTIEFVISKENLSDYKGTLTKNTAVYTGEVWKLEDILKDQDIMMTSNTTEETKKVTFAYTAREKEGRTICDPGTYHIDLVADSKVSYKGTLSDMEFTIVKRPVNYGGGNSFNLGDNYIGNNYPFNYSISLTTEEDGTVAAVYQGRDNDGNAYYYVTEKDLAYTTNRVRPTVTMTDVVRNQAMPESNPSSISVSYGENMQTGSVEDHAGVVTISGAGDYYDSDTKAIVYFAIGTDIRTNFSVRFASTQTTGFAVNSSGVMAQKYQGKDLVPDVEVVYGTTKLAANTDYDLYVVDKDKNKLDAGSYTNAGEYWLMAEGKGRYYGKIYTNDTLSYKIEPTKLTPLSFTMTEPLFEADPIIYKGEEYNVAVYAGREIEPAVSKIMVRWKDASNAAHDVDIEELGYKKEVTYSNNKDSSFVIRKNGTEKMLENLSSNIQSVKSAVPTVTVTLADADGNFYVDKSAAEDYTMSQTFLIAPMDLNTYGNLKLGSSECDYAGGEPVVPSYCVTATKDGTALDSTTLKKDTDYTEEATNNVLAGGKNSANAPTLNVVGTATTGGNFMGILSSTFDIYADMKDAVVEMPSKQTAKNADDVVLDSVYFKNSSGDPDVLERGVDYSIEKFAVNGTKASFTLEGNNDNYYTGTTAALGYDLIDSKSYTVSATLKETRVAYTGNALVPQVDKVLLNNVAYEGDLDITYYTDSALKESTATIVESGTYYVKVALKDYVGLYAAPTFTVGKYTNMSAATVKVSPDYWYDGAVHKPESIVVTVGGSTLKSGTDYSVSGSFLVGTSGSTTTTSPSAVNTYRVQVTGKGSYIGTNTTGSYKIKDQTALSESDVSISPVKFIANGSAQTPSKIVVKKNGTTLTKDRDYTISYRQYRNDEAVSIKASDCVTSGLYFVVVKGVESQGYKGTVEKGFQILDATSDLTVNLSSKSKTYDGSAVTPTVSSVTDKSGTAISPSTYKVTIRNASGKTVKSATAAGTYTVEAAVNTRSSDYYGRSGSTTFTINPLAISSSKIDITGTSGSGYVYTGKEIKPTLTVTFDAGSTTAKADSSDVVSAAVDRLLGTLTVQAASSTIKTLKRGTDYTVSYSNNEEPGTATATITGKGNFKGTTKETFKILRIPMAKPTAKAEAATKILLSWDASQNAQRYEVTYKDRNDEEVTETTSKTSMEISDLSANTSYTFAVRAYRANSAGVKHYSVTQKVTGKTLKSSSSGGSSSGGGSVYVPSTYSGGTYYSSGGGGGDDDDDDSGSGGGSGSSGSGSSNGTKVKTPKAKNVTANSDGTGQVTVKWKDNHTYDGVEVFRSSDGVNYYKIARMVTKNKYTNRNLTSGHTYFFKVRAFKYNGLKKKNAKMSKAKVVTVQ
ncbi:MAG: fibronectin type III domain-containing protein, partial [Lachnospiraceae bacterium]|nr:fibronectin type III domain-containing protein [Lachnospiraceae bacterium]